MRYVLTFFLLLGLAACGDPLAGIEKLEDVELATSDPVAQALPDATELEEDAGLLSSLTSGDSTDAGLNETEQASAKPGGLRGWLRRSTAQPAERESVDTAPVPAENAIVQDLATPDQTSDDRVADAVDTPETSVEPEKRQGLFARLKAANAQQAPTEVAVLDTSTPDEDAVVAVAVPKPRAEVEETKRRGLFGGPGPQVARNGPDARDVDFGTVLPYGQVARVCGAKGENLGRKIEKAPARGRGYTLYDPFPNSTAPRTFYLTGFQDGCPRQFTAALALLGTPTLHEQLRYGRPSSEYPYSTTDKAYEKVKSSVCRVGKRKPCGSKITELEKSTVFVTTYERFGGNAQWADMLIHDGTVLATSLKKP